jgi:glutamate dehydrogenase/leucine dehydrogenase
MTFKGKRAIIQGWGNVGAAAAYYLSQAGVKVVGIIDRAGGIMHPEGLSKQDVRSLFLKKEGNKLSAQNLLTFEEINETIWDLEAEIFLPCAASRLVEKTQIDRLTLAGLELIACGANVPFADKEIFFGPIMEYADERVSIVPDFIANLGMARVFAYCMGKNVEMSDEAIFSDTSETIRKALTAIFEKNSTKLNMAGTGFEIALSQLI